jgi:hypothetical protein
LVSIGGDLSLELVEEVHTVDLTDIQNPPRCCGMSFGNVNPSDEVLNPDVDQDLVILKQYWEYKDAREQRVYTNEKDIYQFFEELCCYLRGVFHYGGF